MSHSSVTLLDMIEDDSFSRAEEQTDKRPEKEEELGPFPCAWLRVPYVSRALLHVEHENVPPG